MTKWIKCDTNKEDHIQYEVIDDDQGKSIKFYPCGVQSWHPKDIECRFCAYCGRFVNKGKQDGES